MKKHLLLLVSLLILGKMFAQDGTLDNTFGNHGTVNNMVGNNSGIIWAMSSVDGWSVVVGGLARNGVDSDFALMRYTRDGVIDSTFGNNGSVVTPMGPGADVIYSTAIQLDGKIVAGGISWNGTHFNFAIARYNTDGSLDNSFGNNGKVITPVGTGDNMGNSLMMMDGWSIVLGGSAFNGTDNDFALVRYTTNGTLDSSFGTNGVVLTDIATGNNDMIAALKVLSDSSIVVAGTTSTPTNNYFALAKYKHDGSLDASFGTNGKVITSTVIGDEEATSIAVQTDGKILVGGYSSNGTNDDFGLRRYMADGTPDGSFGTAGLVRTSIGDTDESMYSLVLQPDGKIIGAGSSIINNKYHYAMIRYNTDGSLDNSFGSSGIVTTAASASDNEVYGAMLQNDGKLVVSGYANDNTNDEFSLARYITGLALGVIDLKASNNSLFIYPNPISAQATLEYTLTQDEQISIRLLNMQGRLVQTIANSQLQKAGDYKQAVILPESLPAGSYLINISSPNGQMSIKIVK